VVLLAESDIAAGGGTAALQQALGRFQAGAVTKVQYGPQQALMGGRADALVSCGGLRGLAAAAQAGVPALVVAVGGDRHLDLQFVKPGALAAIELSVKGHARNWAGVVAGAPPFPPGPTFKAPRSTFRQHRGPGRIAQAAGTCATFCRSWSEVFNR